MLAIFCPRLRQCDEDSEKKRAENDICFLLLVGKGARVRKESNQSLLTPMSHRCCPQNVRAICSTSRKQKVTSGGDKSSAQECVFHRENIMHASDSMRELVVNKIPATA